MEPPVAASETCHQHISMSGKRGVFDNQTGYSDLQDNCTTSHGLSQYTSHETGSMLRRASTFTHRTERALKDVNGRLGLVKKSQDHPLTSKPTVDAQKLTRPSKQYSAVASRYAAPLASKKAVADASHGGHSNMTKLPFITGRSAPIHQRRPSSDIVSSFQPPMVFAASSRDAKPDTLTKKGDANGSSFGAKRPRVGVRASMLEKKSPAQTRAPRFLSLDKGGCTCSKSSPVRGSVEAGSSSLLYSAAHWVSLVKLAEGEKKHSVVVELFRLAISLKAEPRKDVEAQLKRYGESCPSDKVVNELVEQCEGSEREVCSRSNEVVDKAVCEPGDSKSASSPAPNDVSGDEPGSEMSIVPGVVSEAEAAVKKDEASAKKGPHFMGRMLSRSATFSVMDVESQSQHAKAEYGKKLEKTLEFLATQAAEHSSGMPEADGNFIPSKCQSPPLACVPDSEISDDQETTGFKIGAKILDLASRIGRKVVVAPSSEIFNSLVREAGSAVASTLSNGSAEKPVDSLSGWLDGDSAEMDTSEVQSALEVDSVDLSPNMKQMDVDSLLKQVVSHILPEAIVKSPVDPTASESNGRPSRHEFHVRRKSWQDAGEQSMTEIVESISRSHRHSLSAEAVFLSAPGSVEGKVKLFTGLAELKVASPGLAEPSACGSACKERHEAEGLEEHMEVVDRSKVVDISQTVKNESQDKDCPFNHPMKTVATVFTPAQAESAVQIALKTESADEVSVVTESLIVQSEGSKVPLAAPIAIVCMKESSKEGDAVPLPILATPSAATPCEPASVAILRVRHRRASSVGNMNSKGPFDLTGEWSSFGDSLSSPSGQSSNSKSKRVSRGYEEVTSRMDLPKPSWKVIVEREMKGSKLKDILIAELPKESSPLAEYVQSQMENQNRDSESESTGAQEKDVNLTCSPARPVRKTTRSSSMKKPAAKEEQPEGAAEPSTAHKHKKQNEGEQEPDASTNGCSTPGSATRWSARIQKKVQSRRNMLFKEEFIYMK